MSEQGITTDDAIRLTSDIGFKVIGALVASQRLGHTRVQSTARDYLPDGDYPPCDDYEAARQVVVAVLRNQTPPGEILDTHPWLPMVWRALGGSMGVDPRATTTPAQAIGGAA